MTAPGGSGTPTRRERRERREQQEKSGSRRRTVIVVIVVLLVIAVAAAGWYLLVRDDDSSSVSTTSSSSTASSSSTSTSSSTTATSTTTTSTTAPTPPADPQAYAQALFTAWANDNRAAAATVADQAAIDSLFATPGSEAAAFTFSGCQGAAGSIFCTWTRPGGQLAMTVRDATGGLPVQVVEVTIGPG